MQRFIQQLMPLVLICAAIIIAAFSLVLLAYLFLIGAIIGFIIFIINSIRHKWFKPKTQTKPPKSSGRIIDSDDWKEL